MASPTMAVSIPIVGIDRVTGVLNVVGKRIAGFRSVIRPVSQALQRLSLPILGIGAAAIKVNLDFDRSLARAFSVSGALVDEQKRLRAVALDLENVLPVGPRDAAKAMEVLAEKGAKAREIFDMLGPAVQLGLADRGIGVERGAAALDDVLDAFRLGSDQSARAANVLAKSAAFAGKGIDEFVGELATVAPMAMATGQSLEQTAFDLAVLDKLGIKSSARGMKTALFDLGTAAELAGVKQVPSLSTAARSLAGAAGDTIPLLKKLGANAGPALAALIAQGVKGLEGLQAEFENVPGLADQAAFANSGLAGAFRGLGKATEQAGIKLGDAGLTKVVEKLSGLVTDAIKWFSALPEPVREATLVFGGLTVALGALAAMFSLVSIPALLVVGALTLIGVAAVVVKENWSSALLWLMQKLKGFQDFFSKTWGEITGVFTDAWAQISEPFRSAKAPVIAMEVGTGAGMAFAQQQGAQATPALAGVGETFRAKRSEAKVEVEFKNLPNGARVRTSGDADIETDLGIRVPGSNP